MADLSIKQAMDVHVDEAFSLAIRVRLSWL